MNCEQIYNFKYYIFFFLPASIQAQRQITHILFHSSLFVINSLWFLVSKLPKSFSALSSYGCSSPPRDLSTTRISAYQCWILSSCDIRSSVFSLYLTRLYSLRDDFTHTHKFRCLRRVGAAYQLWWIQKRDKAALSTRG